MKRMIFALIGLGLVVGGCSYLNSMLGLKDDNPIEEGIESMIEHQTGLDIDLTPGTPEGK